MNQTPKTSKQTDILQDSFDMVVNYGDWPQYWITLTQLIRATTGSDHEFMMHTLQNIPVKSKRAAWLKASALISLDPCATHFRLAAERIDGDVPPEGIQNWLGLAWSWAIKNSSDAVSFSQRLNEAEYETVLYKLVKNLEGTKWPSLPASDQRGPIVIYCPDLANVRHGPTQFSISLAHALKHFHHEVVLCSLQESSLTQPLACWGGDLLVRPEPLELEIYDWCKRHGVQLYQINKQLSLRKRSYTLAQMLRGIRPRLIVFVGFASAFITLLAREFPVLGLSTHIVPSPVPQDVCLTAKPEWCPWKITSITSFSHFTARNIPRNYPSTSSNFRDTLTLLAVGFRLDIEIDAAWAKIISEVISKFKQTNIELLLIGSTQIQTLQRFLPNIRVLQQAPVKDVYPYLARTDIVLNPIRMGGGGVIASAMEMGIPVVSLQGGDGGKKLQHFAVSDMSAYTTLLETLISSSEARCQMGQALKDLFDRDISLLTQQAHKKLSQAFALAEENFDRRIKFNKKEISHG